MFVVCESLRLQKMDLPNGPGVSSQMGNVQCSMLNFIPHIRVALYFPPTARPTQSFQTNPLLALSRVAHQSNSVFLG